MSCIFPACKGHAVPVPLPFGGRVVWVCMRHRGWALLGRLRELTA